ncbi:MAG TPA: hypothetical protein VF893_01565 [Candidatus Bathyarchaeia archaeon]
MRKKATALIMALLITAAAGTFLVRLGKANPYFYEKVPYPVSPPPDVNPPSILILSPKNDAVQTSSNISLNFNVNVAVPTLPELFYSNVYLADVYYKASWLPNSTHFDVEHVNYSVNHTRFFAEENYVKWHTYWAVSGYELSPSFSVNLTGVPDGVQSVEVFAVLQGSRGTGSSEAAMTIYYGTYELRSSLKVNFRVESTSILLPQNKTYDSSNVPLLFKVHNSVTALSYELDGNERVPVIGNTTLSRLPNGNHNLTIYTVDSNGDTAASETLFFTVDAPEVFPVVPLAAAVIIAVAAAAGLLLYNRKRHKEAQQT